MSSLKSFSQAFHADIVQGAVEEGLVEKLLESHQELCTSVADSDQRIKSKGLLTTRDEFNHSDHESTRRVAQKFAGGYRILKEDKHFESLFRDMIAVLQVAGFFLNTNGFLKTIEFLGDDEQVKEWRSKVFGGQAIGCYGQTEIGHGSNVQGLETQAHYDAATKTFTLKSPSSSAAKYWPGLLGTFGTHAVLQAQTFVSGKNIGVQTFVVAIRNEKLMPFDRIEVGDIGSKLGMNKTDNGYLMLHDYVVPKSAMLSRYIKIDDQGTVSGLENKQNLKYAYGSMLNLRVLLVSAFGSTSLKSTRYFMNLHQTKGTLKDKNIEKQLINDFCVGYGIIIANKRTYKQFRKFTKHLRNKQFKEADELLTECHIVSSTCKALVSWKTHGIMGKQVGSCKYSVLKSSAVPLWYLDMSPAPTYEGDNSVLLQLTAKHLFKGELGTSPKPGAIVDPNSIESMTAAAAYVSEREVERVRDSLGKALESGKDMEDIWNEDIQREVIEMSKIWGNYILIKSFSQTLDDIQAEHRPFYRKIGLVFCGQLILDIKRLPFYGLKFEPIDDVTAIFSQDEKAILFDSFDPFAIRDSYTLNSDYLDKKGAKLMSIVHQNLKARL